MAALQRTDPVITRFSTGIALIAVVITPCRMLIQGPTPSPPDPSAPRTGRLPMPFGKIRTWRMIDVEDGVAVEEMLRRYRLNLGIEYAEPDYRFMSASVLNDPKYSAGTQWHLDNYGQNGGKPVADTRAAAAWKSQTWAAGIVVAVIDSRIRYTHEDLVENMWANIDEIPENGIGDGKGYVDDIHGIDAPNRAGGRLSKLNPGYRCFAYASVFPTIISEQSATHPAFEIHALSTTKKLQSYARRNVE